MVWWQAATDRVDQRSALMLIAVAMALIATEAVGQHALAAQGADQLMGRVSSGAWDTFTARVVIRRRLVGADGRPLLPGAATDEGEQFILRRTLIGSGSTADWKTTMTLVEGRPVTALSQAGAVQLPNRPAVVRLEDDGVGTSPRFFNRDGVEVAVPSEEVRDRFRRESLISAAGTDGSVPLGVGGGGMPDIAGMRPVHGREWIRSLVMSSGDRARRLRALEQRFGRRVGTVRGLGRYVRESVVASGSVAGAREVHEVLMDEQSGVPVEANIVQGADLVSHSLFAYERSVSGAIVRRAVRTERLVSHAGGTAVGRESGRSGSRVVSEISYSDMRLDQKGGR